MVKHLLILLVVFAIGGGVGYYFAPGKIKEVEIVRKEVDTRVVTRERIVTQPDGTKVEERTTEKDRSTEINSSKERTVERRQLDWMVGGGAIIDPLNPLDPAQYYTHLQRRIIGELYIGIMATTEPQVGLGFSLRF